MSEFRISVPPNVDKLVRFFSALLIFWSGRLEKVAVPRSFCLSITGSLVPVLLRVREVWG